MPEIERLTITLPADMAALVRGAVEGGDYASSSEVVREALREWKMRRMLQLQELASLRADIDKGLTDLAEGRVRDFDAGKIIARGKKAISDTLTLRLTEAAENDLDEIWDYLAEEASEAVAAEFIHGMLAACEPVRRFPLSVPPRERLGIGLRVVFHGSYAIYYRPLPDAIVIIRILHGKRDVEAIAERGGFLV